MPKKFKLIKLLVSVALPFFMFTPFALAIPVVDTSIEALKFAPDVGPIKKIESVADCKKENSRYEEWCLEKNVRNQAINDYYAKNPDLAKHFIYGASGQGYIPMIIFKVLPELFPEIWGPLSQYNNASATANYNHIGLVPNRLEPNYPVPLGLSISPSLTESEIDGSKFRMNLVGFNCLACHANAVINEKSKLELLIGAPNTRITAQTWLLALSTKSPTFKLENFQHVIATKPLGWIYNYDPKMLDQEILERKLLANSETAKPIIDGLLGHGQRVLGLFQNYISPKMYPASPTTPNPYGLLRGSMDGLMPTYLSFVGLSVQSKMEAIAKINANTELSPEAKIEEISKVEQQFKQTLDFGLPTQSAHVDTSSLWNQENRGGNHWDGALHQHMFRNTGSAAGVFNKPVFHENISRVNQFMNHLPSDPYPFDIDLNLARKGKKLFVEKKCSTCHAPQNRVIDWTEVKTDKNRLDHFTVGATGFMKKLLPSLCTHPTYCVSDDGSAVDPNTIVAKTNGYVGGRLDGIWARAPYLHNGSVPTLRALLTGQRPEKFWRGSLEFDQKGVGYKWETESPGTVLYNTKLDGHSNSGHLFDSQYWLENTKETNALIEYLKTL